MADAASGKGLVIVCSTKDGLATDIESGRHRLKADHFADEGGSDLGPTPYDLLLAALGS